MHAGNHHRAPALTTPAAHQLRLELSLYEPVGRRHKRSHAPVQRQFGVSAPLILKAMAKAAPVSNPTNTD